MREVKREIKEREVKKKIPSFFPTGTKDPLTKGTGVVERSDVFNAVLKSCVQVLLRWWPYTSSCVLE